jgi:aurora kinase, other
VINNHGAFPIQLLQYTPTARLSLDKVMKHPWIVKYEERSKGPVRPSEA